MSVNQSKHVLKTMSDYAGETGLPYNTIKRGCEELLGTTRITTTLQKELFEEYLAIKISNENLTPKRIVADLYATRAEDIKIARAIAAEGEKKSEIIALSDEQPDMYTLEEIASGLKVINQQLMSLEEKIDSLVSNPVVKMALTPALRNNYKVEFGRKVLALHSRLDMRVGREAVYRSVNMMLSRFGIACTGMAISDVIDMADTGSLSVTKDTCLGIIYKIAERHSEEGEYNDEDYVIFMEMGAAEEPVEDLTNNAKVKVRYINSLVSPYTNRHYYNLTIRDYCAILMTYVAEHHEEFEDPMGLYSKIEAASMAFNALDEITCPVDTPDFEINSARKVKHD